MIAIVIIAYLIVDFGDKLIDLLADSKAVEPELIITVIVGLIGTGIGGLIIAMGRMFDSPSSVPADLHERPDGERSLERSQATR